MFEKIVVGYAGDDAGRDAVRLAANLAGMLGSQLTVVYPYHPLLATHTGEQAETRVREDMQALTAGVDGLPAITYRWTSSRWPIHGLHELASYEHADLIVFGISPERLAHHLHVSLVERMVHGAPCAVAVAPAGYADGVPRKLRHIGVGFSDSQEGKATVALGHELARRSAGELELIAGSGLGPSLTAYAYSSALLPHVEDLIYVETKTQLEQIADSLGESVPIYVDVHRGDPARVLSARSEHLDLLVLGSRAYGPLRHALLGSVSASVISEARCPVLVVPRGAVELSAHGELETYGSLGVS